MVFLRIQRKSTKEDDRTGRPVVYRSLAKTSDEWLSGIHSILLQMDRLQLTAVDEFGRVDLRMSQMRRWSPSTGKPVAQGYPGYPGNSGNTGTEGNDEDWPRNLHISPNQVLRMEMVFSIARQRYGRSPTDQMKNLDVNTALCFFFMSVALQAAIHLVTDYAEHLQASKNQPLKSLKQLCQVTERLITDPTEITGLTTIDWQQPVRRETTVN